MRNGNAFSLAVLQRLRRSIQSAVSTQRAKAPTAKRARSNAMVNLTALSVAFGLVLYPEFATTEPQEPRSPLDGMTEVTASKEFELPTTSDEAAVNQGRYLVGLLGCASCHTDGALVGKPNPQKMLAGSTVGIAYSNPMINDFPGAVYPANLTPDDETGLGKWTLKEIVTLIRSGRDRHGRQTMAIMPWTSYAQLSDDDALAIAHYLQSLPPVKNAVPPAVQPGNPAKTPLVHVGLYRSN